MSVSEARRAMSCSRNTFYRTKRAQEEGGVEALREPNRRRPNRISKDRNQDYIPDTGLKTALI
ncbi:MAG: helix-turn-helix domain-containing protein [Deltaproteobacteria bacterium]|nr:helix-turn-helix domain-containing protein [Deltaproteobacteria bacterium]